MTKNIKWNTREATKNDLEEIALLYIESRAEAMPFLPKSSSKEELLEYFRTEVFAKTLLLVVSIYESSDPEDIGKIAGFLSLREKPKPLIEHLYIAPKYWYHRVGTLLLGLAMRSCPSIDLYCFQKNKMAREFYELHGFEAIKLSDGQDNTENEPDILYRWIREYHKWSDAEYIQIFESLNLPIYEWTHQAHVRVAWIYLSAYPFPKALHKIRTGIQNFYQRNGFFKGYHETVTQAYAILILDRIRSSPPYTDFAHFISENSDLLDHKNPPINRYYSMGRLWSDEGCSSFLQPDMKPLPPVEEFFDLKPEKSCTRTE